MRELHWWTEEEREVVRRDYRHTSASLIAIAKLLSKPGDKITPNAVKGQVAFLGISKSSRHHWDAEQDDRLRELFAKYAARGVAKKMHCTVAAVVLRAKRLGIGRRYREGWYTKSEVAGILGVDHKWIQIRIDSGKLKASYHDGVRPTNSGGYKWHIEESDLRDFIRRYPQDLVGRNIDIIAIVELLAGILNGSKI